MRSILGLFGAVFVYGCMASFLTLVVGLGYLWQTGKLNKEKAFRVLAMVHDVDIDGPKAGGGDANAAGTRMQLSFEDIEVIRGVKARDIELKTQALERGRNQILFEREQLADDKSHHEMIKTSFKEMIITNSNKAKQGGYAAVQQVLENMPPKQAKEQILKMVEKGEIEEAVVMLSPMSVAKRAKIFKTFTEPEEIVTMDSILRLIRNGNPDSALIEKTKEQLKEGK